jgi:glycosyltransferase involved in cell wall biosynthesis
MEKLRLAVFNTQPPLYLGGVERRILEIAKRLQGQVDITIYSGTKGGLRYPIAVEGARIIPCKSTDRLFPLDNWTFNRSLSKMSEEINADVYESHTVSGYGFQNATRRKNVKAPFITTVHGVLADEYIQAKQLQDLSLRGRAANFFMNGLAKIEKDSAIEATMVVTISEYSEKKIVELYGVSKNKIRRVPNGVDTERFKPLSECEEIKRRLGVSDRQIVLFVGRLIPRKGLPYLIEAADVILRERKETVFLIVGNGPLKEPLIADIKARGISGNFRFLGDVSEDDLTKIYGCADVFAFPSIQEGQGIALLEAQASAKPVVAFNVSGISETVKDGETAILTRSTNTKGIAEGILQLLSNDSLREKMGKKGREFVRNSFSWDICSMKMLRVYQEAIDSA